MSWRNYLALILLGGLQVYSKPLLYATFSYPTANNKGFINWSFGWPSNWGGESEVTVVDRSPGISWDSRPAAFGPEITSPLLGYVIPLSSFTVPGSNTSSTQDNSSNTGCPPLQISGPLSPDPTESWIALVQRGSCEFVAKVREAQRLGARAVVVGGMDPTLGYPDLLLNMFSKDDAADIEIPSTFITHASYQSLLHLIENSSTSHRGLHTLSLLITAQYNTWEWYSPIVTFVTILFLPSILTFITLFVHRMRMIQAAQRERAPENVVRALESIIWQGTEGVKDEENSGGDNADSAPSTSQPSDPTPWFKSQVECPICLSEFAKGDAVRILPCHHIFHMEEVDEWLTKRRKLCPVCKKDVTAPLGDQSTPPAPTPVDAPSQTTIASSPMSVNASPSVDETTPLLRPSSSAPALTTILHSNS